MTEVPLAGKRVFIRADLNVPIDNGRITDDTRIRASLQAIQYALKQGAAAVMVASHLGRPKEGQFDEKASLAPIARHLSALLGMEVPLIRHWVDVPNINGTELGRIVLLENCRFNKGEKEDDEALARKIAALCDVYVNDAFGAAHRAEATTHAVARFAPVACAGPLMAAELDALGRALAQPKRPLAAIVGGSKVSTKLAALAGLAKKVDQLIVGGGIANTFLLAAGKPIGKSLAEQVGFGKRFADWLSGGKQERIGDAAADDQLVDLFRQAGERGELRRHLRAADNRGERTLGLRERAAQRIELCRHQRPGTGDRRESRNRVRGRFRAMRGTEGVVHIDVAQRGDFPRQGFVVLLFAFVEPAVFQEHYPTQFRAI